MLYVCISYIDTIHVYTKYTATSQQNMQNRVANRKWLSSVIF